jgi:hypothetical protein
VFPTLLEPHKFTFAIQQVIHGVSNLKTMGFPYFVADNSRATKLSSYNVPRQLFLVSYKRPNDTITASAALVAANKKRVQTANFIAMNAFLINNIFNNICHFLECLFLE